MICLISITAWQLVIFMQHSHATSDPLSYNETEKAQAPLEVENEIGEPLSPLDFQYALDLPFYSVEGTIQPIENEQLFEGDMDGIRSVEDLKSATTDANRLWPGAQIPYVISASYSNHRNFAKLDSNTIQLLGTPYDAGSVMHYEKFAFARDRNIPTIISRKGHQLGNKKGFTKIDIVKLNRFYKCDTNVKPDPGAPTKPKENLKDCSDKIHANCGHWSMNKGCANPKNFQYMLMYCRKTCNLCK